MADTENTGRSTDNENTQRTADQHDPWGRVEVTPDSPNWGMSTPPQKENADSFGVVSAELVAEEDPDNPGVAKVTDEARQAEQDAQRQAQADRDKA